LRTPLDNNESERALKQFILMRKNSIFANDVYVHRTQGAVMAGALKLLPPTFRIGFPVIMWFSAFVGLAVI
jgi:transposase IS66 family protein